MKLYLILPLALIAATVVAQPADNRAAARDAFAEARALFSSDINGSVALLRKAIELDPDYCEGHQYYTLYARIAATRTGTDDEKKAASDKVTAELQALYEGWAKEQPGRAAYQYALGNLCLYSDPDRALRHLETAVRIDPKCGAAYDMLAICAEVRGELAQSVRYLRQAVEVEPDNPTNWRHLIGALREADVDEGLRLGLEMAKRFPDQAAGIIGYLAMRQRDERKGREIYELLREKFPKAAAGNLTGLFPLYLKSDPAQALALAEEMAALVPDNKQWPVLVGYAKAVRDTDSLIAQGKAADTLVALGEITLPRYGADPRWLDLAKARALAAAEGVAKAYEHLLAACVKTPTDETLAALFTYGQKLDKDAAAVSAEVMARRAAAAVPAVPFKLTDYRTGRAVSLDDYKGRVVLVNFWYPMCGPCRGEFPFLQAVLEKYRDRGFEILAINGHAPEDHMVMPLLQGWKLDFLPLKADDAVVKDYKVRGFPANFLCGPDGRIYYEPPPVGTIKAQRELELHIEALLAQTKA